MSPSDPARPGIVGVLQTLGDGLLGSVEDRVALLALEIEEEKRRLIRTMIWISATIFTAVMTAGLATLTVVYLFWESARIGVLGGLAAFYGALLVTSIVALRRASARQERPLAATIAELQEDRACIRGET